MRVGLGTFKVGQQATRLFRRAKRSASSVQKSSANRTTGRTLYILDEPHPQVCIFEDVRKLLEVAATELVESGESVVVIEHNLV